MNKSCSKFTGSSSVELRRDPPRTIMIFLCKVPYYSQNKLPYSTLYSQNKKRVFLKSKLFGLGILFYFFFNIPFSKCIIPCYNGSSISRFKTLVPNSNVEWIIAWLHVTDTYKFCRNLLVFATLTHCLFLRFAIRLFQHPSDSCNTKKEVRNFKC